MLSYTHHVLRDVMHYKSFQETASVREKCVVQISMFSPKYSKTSLTQCAQN
jgi:hypothetical protein